LVGCRHEILLLRRRKPAATAAWWGWSADSISSA
jgi:hypothetical protein